MEERDRSFTELKSKIETMKERNNERIAFLSHGIGCKVMHYFLQWVNNRGSHLPEEGDFMSGTPKAEGDRKRKKERKEKKMEGEWGEEWIEKYIKMSVCISPCWLGNPVIVRSLLTGFLPYYNLLGHDDAIAAMMRSFSSLLWSLPFGMDQNNVNIKNQNSHDPRTSDKFVSHLYDDILSQYSEVFFSLPFFLFPFLPFPFFPPLPSLLPPSSIFSWGYP